VQAVLVLALLMLIPLAVEYTRQTAVKRQWQQAETQLQAELATAVSLRATLEARKQFVHSDAYVEEAARARLRMARPGDVVIVAVMTRERPEATQAAQPQATPTPAPWWRRLFGR
jgi:cell division protein FtsB